MIEPTEPVESIEPAPPAELVEQRGSTLADGAVVAVQREINDLRGRLPHIRGALVVGDTGDPITADLTLTAQRELAAQVAVSAAVGARLAATAGVGLVTEVTVHSEDGYVALYPAGPRAALAVVATPAVNLGRLHLQARHTAALIGVVLARADGPADATDMNVR